MSGRPRRRDGFTLIELLVVIAIIALLIGMLLSAVQKVRDSGIKSVCYNNLKQIGIAINDYHDNYGKLPPGRDDHEISAHAYLLPFLDQAPLYRRINFAADYDDPSNAYARGTVVKGFLCPADPNMERLPAGIAGNSYRCNQGTGVLWGNPPTNPSNSNYGMPAPNGPFFENSRTRFATITDGVSQTAAFSEHLIGDFNNGVSTPNDTFWPKTKPANADEAIAQCNSIDTNNLAYQRVSDVGGPWLQGYHSTTIYFHVAPPGSRSCMFPPGRIATSANSGHFNSVNVVLFDGSVRNVMNAISLQTWRALGTIDGNDILGSDW